MTKSFIAISLLALSACANVGRVPLSGDTDIVSIRSTQEDLVNPNRTQQTLLSEANERCASVDKKVEIIHMHTANPGGDRAISAALQFRCV